MSGVIEESEPKDETSGIEENNALQGSVGREGEKRQKDYHELNVGPFNASGSQDSQDRAGL